MRSLIRDAGGWVKFGISILVALAIVYFLIFAIRTALNDAASKGVPGAAGGANILQGFEHLTQPY